MTLKIKLFTDPKTGLVATEVWKSIPNYVGLYKVSNYGRVKNLRRIVYRGNGNHPRQIQERLLKPCADGRGYYTVKLCGRTHKVHVLVATAFCHRKKHHTQVNHIIRDKRNNTSLNLEWCTGSQNIKHSFLDGKRIRGEGERNAMAKYSNSLIRKVKKDMLIFSDKMVAEKYNIAYKYINAIRNGRARKNS